MDNAKIYRSPQLARIAASIGILIVHTPPYQPVGRGKIERFFRSVREQFLASLDPKVLLSIEQLNERLWHWLEAVYHRHEHSSLQTRRCCAGSALSNRSASFRQPLICGVSSFIAWTGWCAAIPRSC
jgi:transposase InsO family protein